MNRFLIIDCYAGAFNNDFNKYFHVPNFEYSTSYDCLYKDKKLDKIFESYIKAKIFYKDGIYFLKDKKITYTKEEILHSQDTIIYFSYSWHKLCDEWYIKVKQNIVDEILTKKLEHKEYIGVHYRNTPDKQNNFDIFIKKIHELYDKCKVVYLSTDDHNAYEKFLSTLGDKYSVLQLTNPFKIPKGGHNIHYSNPNKDEVILNALIDMYHLTYSTYFIASNNSSFSKKIIELRQNDNFFK